MSFSTYVWKINSPNPRIRRERRESELLYIINIKYTHRLCDPCKIILLAKEWTRKPRRSINNETTTTELSNLLTSYNSVKYFSSVSPKEQGQFLEAPQVEVYRGARILLETFPWEQIWPPGGTMSEKWRHS